MINREGDKWRWNKLTVNHLTNCVTLLQRVLQQQEIMKLSDALQYYVGFMRATKYPCPDYRAEKVKQKLQNHDTGKKYYLHLLK